MGFTGSTAFADPAGFIGCVAPSGCAVGPTAEGVDGTGRSRCGGIGSSGNGVSLEEPPQPSSKQGANTTMDQLLRTPRT